MAAGLSQQALAKAAKVDYTTVSELELDKRRPMRLTAERIGAVLDREPGDLWDTFGHSAPRTDDPLPRRLRLERGLSQREVGQRTGLKRGVVQRAEAGERVAPANAKAIAVFYGVDVIDFQGPPAPRIKAAA